MKRTLLLLLFPMAVYADQCVLQDRTVTAAALTIHERSGLRREVVPLPNGNRRCQVSFRARIGNEWHTANGHYDWVGDVPSNFACSEAVKQADYEVLTRVGRTRVVSEKSLVCRDDQDLSLIKDAAPGVRGKLHQFNPHPQYPNRFWHNGTQCRWFIEPAWNGRDIHSYSGIICALNNDQWVVVDRF
jgi:hypothetical protein